MAWSCPIPKLHPFWAKAEELGVLIFIHPQGTPELEASGRLKGNGALDNVIGNPLETTIALSHLIFEGTLDRFPGLKICGAHAGGYLPSYAARSDADVREPPDQCKVPLKKKPSEYLRAALFRLDGLHARRACATWSAEVGTGQIVMGTDYAVPVDQRPRSITSSIRPGFSDAERDRDARRHRRQIARHQGVTPKGRPS